MTTCPLTDEPCMFATTCDDAQIEACRVQATRNDNIIARLANPPTRKELADAQFIAASLEHPEAPKAPTPPQFSDADMSAIRGALIGMIGKIESEWGSDTDDAITEYSEYYNLPTNVIAWLKSVTS